MVAGNAMPLDFAHTRAPSPTKNLDKKERFLNWGEKKFILYDIISTAVH